MDNELGYTYANNRFNQPPRTRYESRTTLFRTRDLGFESILFTSSA
jgi:hypothetical protein